MRLRLVPINLFGLQSSILFITMISRLFYMLFRLSNILLFRYYIPCGFKNFSANYVALRKRAYSNSSNAYFYNNCVFYNFANTSCSLYSINLKSLFVKFYHIFYLFIYPSLIISPHLIFSTIHFLFFISSH